MTLTPSCRHWFQLVFLVNLLLFQQNAITANEEAALPMGDDAMLDDSMFTLMDSILEDLTNRYDKIKTDDFWHPYEFGTGSDNREVINVVGITERQISGKFLQWKKVQLGLKQQLVGLTSSSIEIYDSKLKQTFKKDLQFALKTMEVFTRWDTESLTPFMVVAVATSAPSIIMLTSTGNEELQEIGSFPLPSSVQSVAVCDVESSEKILLVPTNPTEPLTIYNMDISQDLAQLWFFQRISETGFESAIVHQPDTEDSMLLVSKAGQLRIYHFDASLGQFSVKQSVPMEQQCGSMTAFMMMYQHYVSCMSKDDSEQVQFINYNFNVHEYQTDSLNKVKASEMFPVAIGGSRGDLIFVTRNAEDAEVKTLIYDGQSDFKTTSIGCSSENCAKLSSLRNGASFDFEDTTALVLPTAHHEDTATVLTFMTEMMATMSPVFQESKDLFQEFKTLSKDVNEWRFAVTDAHTVLRNKLNTNGDNVLTGNWDIKTLIAEDVDVDGNQGRDGRAATSEHVFNSLKFGSVHWTEEDFQSTDANILESLSSMDEGLQLMEEHLNDALLKSGGVEIVRSKVTMQGMIKAGKAAAKFFNVNSIWESDTTEYFQNLANAQDQVLNVEGGLTFVESLTTTSVETEKINNIFVDNMAVLSGPNVFQCPTTFDKIVALRDVNVEVVNGRNLADSVVMVNDVTGFHFTEGVVAYMGAETLDRLPFGDVLRSSVVQTVEAPMSFNEVVVQAPMSVNNLNGQNFNTLSGQIIRNNHQGKIRGKKTFTDSIHLNTLFISNKWNDLAFPGDFSSVLSDSVVLNGKNSFANIVANKMTVAREIDGINTDDLVSLSKAEVLDSSRWKFTGPTKILKNIAVANTVDGVQMESLHHQGFLNAGTPIISPNAHIVFEQPVHIEHLSVFSTINDRTFEELFGDLILFDGAACRVPGMTTISHTASFDDMKLSDSMINDFTLTNFLTWDTAQTITKPVTIENSVFFEEFHALEEIDGVRVQHILEKAMRVSKTMREETMIPWDVHFESIACEKDLVVDGPINNVAAYVTKVAVTNGKSTQTIAGPIVAENPVFSSLVTGNIKLTPGRTLQTLDVNEWDVTRAKLSEPAIFSQRFSANRITVKGDLNSPIVNGISVDDLKTKVFRNNGQSQHFTGQMNLANGLLVENGDLQFHQNIDGENLDDIIAHGFPLKALNDKPIVIKHGWQFESLKINNDIQVNGNVCGVDLDELQTDSVKRTDSNVQIFGEKSFSQSLQITEGLKSPQINGKQLDKIFLLHQDQEVESHLTFASDVFKDVLTVDSINNVDLATLAEKYSFVDGKHVIAHNAKIKHGIKTTSLRVNGKTRNQDLESFIENTVKLSDPNISFEDEVIMTNPISVEDDINTVMYNGINVDDLSTKVIRLNEDITLSQPVSFTDTVSAEDVIINGDVKALSLSNGVNWNDLQTKSMKLDNVGKPLIFRKAHFEDLKLSTPIKTEELNGRPFEDFVTLNTDQHLGTLKIANVNLESSTVNIGGKFGSRDISEEFEDTLMNNKAEPQRLPGTTVFQGPMHIKENFACFGSALKDDVVTTTDELELGPMEFTSPIVVENDVVLTEPISGHSVESLFSGAFMTESENSEQVISNLWEFHGPVTFMNNVTGKGVQGKLNIQALVDTKNDELERAEKKVDAERESFIRKCKSLHKMRNKIAKNPVKLDSFDSHQVIGLKNEGTNVLVAESNNGAMLFVQSANCQVERYQWLPSTELFHKVVEDTSPNIGNVDMWQAVPMKEGGSLIVFSKKKSSCSQDSGLFSVTVSPTGQLSPVAIIRENLAVKSFKVAKRPDTGEIRLFNLIKSVTPGVEVFEWDNEEFSFKEFFHLNSPMDRVDVTASSRGFGVMCHNENAVTMYDISNDHSQDVEASGSMLASKTGSMAVFQNFDTLYALLPESGTNSPSLIQPTCNFQVMRLGENSIESIQKLQVPEVVSSTMLSFSNKNFISFLSKSHGLTVHKFMGLNGFQQLGKPYKVFDGIMLKSFAVKTTGFDRPHPFLLVLSKNAVEIFRGNVFGDTLISDFEQLCNS